MIRPSGTQWEHADVARKKTGKPQAKPAARKSKRPDWKPVRIRATLRRVARVLIGLSLIILLWVISYRFINPPGNYYMLSERLRLGSIDQSWVALEDLPAAVPLAAMAAEDAGFCEHFGFDFDAIRTAIESNKQGKRVRGASTISQQVAKNVFLWPDRSWVRKGLEVGFTGLIEVFWPKRRIVEVYVNIAEFDEGVFGVGAAAPHYFGKAPGDLSERDAARLAAILPAPKSRSASRPGSFTRRRAASIQQGIRTLAVDGRGACLER